MGADLLLCVLEIEKDRKPDWGEMHAALDRMEDGTLLIEACEVMHGAWPTEVLDDGAELAGLLDNGRRGSRDGLTSAEAARLKASADPMRARLHEAIGDLRRMVEDYHRYGSFFRLAKTDALIFGGVSWGGAAFEGFDECACVAQMSEIVKAGGWIV